MSLPGGRSAHGYHVATIAGIPVTVSPYYALLPILALGRSSSVLDAVAHVTAITASVLVHELGHAFAAKEYRLRPSITLHALGGWCAHLPAQRRSDELVVTAAGPGAGLLLGALAWSLTGVAAAGPLWLSAFLADLAWMGLAWSLVNLLPVLPLDGGQILLNRLQERPGAELPERTAWTISRATAVLATLAALVVFQPGAAILFGVLAVHAHQQLRRVPKLDNLLEFGRKPKKSGGDRARRAGDRTGGWSDRQGGQGGDTWH